MGAVAGRFRRLFDAVLRTPFHPQWHVFRGQEAIRRDLGAVLNGVVLDIGCAGSTLRGYLPESVFYVGLDLPATANVLYGTRPQVYGDGQCLPFAGASLDSVALMDVLEHMPEPEQCLREIGRVLRPRGILVLQVPFLYPLHDEPYDFQRFTEHKLKRLLGSIGFVPRTFRSFGHPLETAAALFSIALSKTVIDCWPQRWPLALGLCALAAVAVPAANLTGWLLARITPEDTFMPLNYLTVCEWQAD